MRPLLIAATFAALAAPVSAQTITCQGVLTDHESDPTVGTCDLANLLWPDYQHVIETCGWPNTPGDHNNDAVCTIEANVQPKENDLDLNQVTKLISVTANKPPKPTANDRVEQGFGALQKGDH